MAQEYTLEEAKEVAKKHKMDIYHREIMLYLIERIERLMVYNKVKQRVAEKHSKPIEQVADINLVQKENENGN